MSEARFRAMQETSIDGFMLLETLKTHPDTANIPVVVVSAKSLTPPRPRHLAGLQRVGVAQGRV
ncbi:MAG: hypothetical protein HC929_19850 [Leptolyngbyaceae cyanobacterium SM2_5_2]|nr:hypothetical protein [Leptolyngbyaceae cyanobacterium SM2_5_2]